MPERPSREGAGGGDRVLAGAAWLGGVVLALLVRYQFRGFESWDFTTYTKIWYTILKERGFSAFQSGFYDYTPAYLYLLYAVSAALPWVSTVAATKLPSVAADFLCAWLTYLIVLEKSGEDLRPARWAFFAVLFAPTVVVNGSLWGQCDSIHTAGLLAFLYFLMVRKGALAVLCFAAAFAVKLQTVFLAPLLAAAVLKRAVSWRWLALIPGVYAASILPAWIMGRPLVELLSVYGAQVEQANVLQIDAPNLYAWLPESAYGFFYPLGLALGAAAAIAYLWRVHRGRAGLTPPVLVELALVSAVLMPFCLPKMHERFFFQADVIAVAYAFWFPRLFFVPILIGLASLGAYQNFLFGVRTVPLPLLGVLMLLALIVVTGRAMASVEGDEGVPPGP